MKRPRLIRRLLAAAFVAATIAGATPLVHGPATHASALGGTHICWSCH